jgi:surfactin synthase thioesterase subunit
MSRTGSPWCARIGPAHDAMVRLVCFPHAGAGAAAYVPLARLMPPSIEVVAIVPPGREGRLRETPLPSIEDMAEGALSGLRSLPPRPFAFFGHSMGALLAWEAARRLDACGLRLPTRLFLSGRRAPGRTAEEPPLSGLDDQAFLAEISRRFDGIPDAILSEPELVQLFLPTLRSDLRSVEMFRPLAGARVAVPTTLIGGTEDPQCTEVAWGGWPDAIAGDVERLHFPGHHFYLRQQWAALAGAITRRLI